MNNNKGCETKNRFNKKRRLNNNESATATCDNSNTNNNLFRPDTTVGSSKSSAAATATAATAAAAAGIVSPVVTQLAQTQESNDSNNNKNSNNNNDDIIDVDDGEEFLRKVMAEAMMTIDAHVSTCNYNMSSSSNTTAVDDSISTANNNNASSSASNKMSKKNRIEDKRRQERRQEMKIKNEKKAEEKNIQHTKREEKKERKIAEENKPKVVAVNNDAPATTTVLNKSSSSDDGVNNHEVTINSNSFNDDDWRVGNLGWERNYDKYPVSFPINSSNNNNSNNDRINEGVQKIKTEPRDSVWVLYNGNNNNINSSSSSNDDDDYHKSQTVSQSRNAMKKDKENSKCDGATNRKRTRDQSEDDESCDDTDDSNIDIDDEDDEGDEDDEDDDDENAFLPEDSADSNQNKDSKSSVVRGKRRRIDNKSLNDTNWEKIFQILVAYKEINKHTMVPQHYKEDPKLGHWVRSQRNKYRDNDMPSNRLDLLNSIDFAWKVDGTWMKMFQRLVAYKKTYKNTMVPSQYDEDPKLGSWVSTQRYLFKKNDLLPDRLAHLNLIDFVWNGGVQGMNKKWDDMLQKLVAYKKLHKNKMVPQPHKKDSKLGRWVCKQRYLFKKNELPKERLDQLNSIGFVWRVHKDVKWDDMFQKLVAYQKAYKHTLVPNPQKEDPKFGRWVSAQRQNFRKNGSFSLLVQAMKCHPCSNKEDKLQKERLDKLDSIGFV